MTIKKRYQKIISFILIAAIAVVTLSGCDSQQMTAITEDVKEAINTIGKPTPTIPEGITTGFAYERLTEPSKELYKQIAYAMENSVDKIETPITGADIILNVVDHVLMDHPEYFWYESGLCYTLNRGGEPFSSELELKYIYNKEEVLAKQAQIDAVVQEILSRIDPASADYDKAKFVYDEIISTTEYNLESADNQNICSVFLNRESVCAGYAKATQYLLQKLGIEATYVWGDVTSEDGTVPHAWNLVKLDQEYYYIDSTWGDPQYESTEDKDLWKNEISYDYFCVTTAEISQTHSTAVAMALPECTATACNYYTRNGLYFETFDVAQIAGVFANAYNTGSYFVSVRFSNIEAYNAAVENIEEIFKNSGIELTQFFYRCSPETRVVSLACSTLQ